MPGIFERLSCLSCARLDKEKRKGNPPFSRLEEAKRSLQRLGSRRASLRRKAKGDSSSLSNRKKTQINRSQIDRKLRLLGHK
ncbi:hypothetical protein FSP39_020967 [Pinctada imbricata]|uniref:Uncharacterized protein n=1 Tax=Pinctada imbricata TaxID=66713 RepID=A0AA88YNK2_PINIB|nr:hypothetical protein FSP39_020967 [Pinctada imbricata]